MVNIKDKYIFPPTIERHLTCSLEELIKSAKDKSTGENLVLVLDPISYAQLCCTVDIDNTENYGTYLDMSICVVSTTNLNTNSPAVVMVLTYDMFKQLKDIKF